MKLLFIHQDIPGQFEPLIQALIDEGGHELRGLGLHFKPHFVSRMPGLQLEYYPPVQLTAEAGETPHDTLQALATGRRVASRLAEWKAHGYEPDIIFCNIGFGESLYIREVFPETPLLGYCEYYFHTRNSNADFVSSSPLTLNDRCLIHTANLTPLLSLVGMDMGICPTVWQKHLFPAEFQRKIRVIHEGVDTGSLKPHAAVEVSLPDGRVLTRATPVVTYATRNLEPYRGFDKFLHAVERICHRRSDCHFIIAGGDEISYSPALPQGETYRQRLLRELDIDHSRVHFVGHRPYAEYVKILQISAVHVYLTFPFVLSWSLLEAMSTACVIVGSDTAPVRELIRDGQNGFLVDFFSPQQLADRIESILDHPTGYRSLGLQARLDIQMDYDRQQSLARYRELMCQVLVSHLV